MLRWNSLEVDNCRGPGAKKDSIGILEQTEQKRSSPTRKICDYLCTVQLPRPWSLSDNHDIVLDQEKSIGDGLVLSN